MEQMTVSAIAVLYVVPVVGCHATDETTNPFIVWSEFKSFHGARSSTIAFTMQSTMSSIPASNSHAGVSTNE